MEISMLDARIRRFEQLMRTDGSDIQFAYPINDYEIRVKFVDDSEFIFNHVLETIRYVNRKTVQELLAETEEEVGGRFAKRLRELLYTKGISQTELSDQTGISLGSIHNYVTNRSVPSLYYLRKIAIVLDASPNELMLID